MSEINSIHEALYNIQVTLDAPKNQYNKFGGYHYRSCEDIFEGLKKVMPVGATVTIADEIVQIGERYYIKATASFNYRGQSVTATAMAREPLAKKGMDESQITGSTSSYARKYALNALFCIDDNKDSDVALPVEDKKQNQRDDRRDDRDDRRNDRKDTRNDYDDYQNYERDYRK